MRICGFAEIKFFSLGISTYLHSVVLAPIRSLGISLERLCKMESSPSERSSKAAFTFSYRSCPSGVRVTPLELRLKRIVSRLSSNFLMARLIAGWLMYSSLAAWEIFPVRLMDQTSIIRVSHVRIFRLMLRSHINFTARR